MILAHDLGTTGDKASLHDDDGRLIAAVTVAYDTYFDNGGIAEQDPQVWWYAVATATQRLLADAVAPGTNIKAIGLSGQMMGAVFLDGAYEPVCPAMIWADTRSTAQAERLATVVGMDRGYRITGHRINPTYSLTKMMWLAEQRPEVFARVRHVCLAKDYVAYRLTGVLATDPSDASSTNAFDQTSGQWSSELTAAAGIDRDLLPRVVASTAVLGGVLAESARALGVTAGTPVVMGGGDGPMAALGAGIVDPADGAYVYLGSSSWVSMSAARPFYDPGMRTMSFNHVVPGRFVPTATMQAGGGSLQWIAEVLDPARGMAGLNAAIDESTTVTAAEQGLYFLPHLLGERSPYWDPTVRATFVGLARHHTRAHLTRAVLEGVGLNLLTCIEAFRQGGMPISVVDAIGGGARSVPWLQLLADVWGVTVRQRSVVEEGNSLGAAIIAGLGTGLIADGGAARELSTVTAVCEPNLARHQRYLAAHQEFLAAYRHTEGWYHRSDEGDAR